MQAMDQIQAKLEEADSAARTTITGGNSHYSRFNPAMSFFFVNANIFSLQMETLEQPEKPEHTKGNLNSTDAELVAKN